MKKFKYVRLRVPYDDEVSLTFLENQVDVSLSIRKLIYENYLENGVSDVFSTKISDFRRDEVSVPKKITKNAENVVVKEKEDNFQKNSNEKSNQEDTLKAMQGLL